MKQDAHEIDSHSYITDKRPLVKLQTIQYDREEMKTKEVVSIASEGLLRGVTNALLYCLYLYGTSFGKSKTSFGAYQMFQETDEALRDVNYDTFKQAFVKLRKQHLISKRRKRTWEDITVTKEGRKRLASTLPVYQKHRPWDGILYLISYDIEETEHAKRDLLREYLRRIGCGLLQESLWLTPYYPRDLLDEFVNRYNVRGTILVSKLGKDGAVGDEEIHDLIASVYKLSDLNKQYKQFLSDVKSGKKTPFQLGIAYLSILDNDPQLPFALLPKDWLGDRAHDVYERIVIKTSSGRESKL